MCGNFGGILGGITPMLAQAQNEGRSRRRKGPRGSPLQPQGRFGGREANPMEAVTGMKRRAQRDVVYPDPLERERSRTSYEPPARGGFDDNMIREMDEDAFISFIQDMVSKRKGSRRRGRVPGLMGLGGLFGGLPR